MIGWLVPLALVVSGAASEPVALEGPTSVEFVDTTSPRVARLAVKPLGVKVSEEEPPQVVEFAAGDLRYDAANSALSASWDLSKDGTPVALCLTLANSVRRPGTYRAVVAPLPASRPTERLTLQITLHAASLKAPEKLVVARTLRFPLAPAIVAPPVILHEQTSTTRIEALHASRLWSNAGGLPVSAGITPGPAPIAVLPGAAEPMPYSLVGSFPLGLVNGKLWLNATELSEPKELDYEVRTRLASWYIPFVIAIGFVLGFLVRTYLANVIAVSRAREQASTLLMRISASLVERQDEIFREKFATERNQLDEALAKNDAAAIMAAIAALDTAWRAAVVEFSGRQATATAALDELSELAAPPLPLPALVIQALSDAHATIDVARAALDGKNVAVAQTVIDDGRNALVHAVHEVALEWQDATEAVLNQLESATLGLPLVVVTEFAQRRRAVATLGQIAATTALATAGDRRTLFLTFHGEYRGARNLLQELANRLDSEWGLIKRQLPSAKTLHNAAFEALETGVASLRDKVAGAADDPKAFAGELLRRLQELDALWRNGLFELAPEAKRADLRCHLESREYLQLARGVGDSLIDPLLSGKTLAPALPIGTWTQVPPEPPVITERASRGLAPLAVMVIPAASTPLQASAARFLQSVLLAAVYIAVYWMIAADSFGEKWTEPAMLLATSFMIDVTAEGLLDALRKLKT